LPDLERKGKFKVNKGYGIECHFAILDAEFYLNILKLVSSLAE
jgi:hypothetical protein